ncbi:MAG: [FeFe] hydrogenase H-cluster radical SAM maturase HydG [bacterium]|nr:[FeFe] hydrogenase H-cluster radical SAM maturase HydG [bacterium]
MKYINEAKIEELLTNSKPVTSGEVDAILQKAKSLQRLSLSETATLLAVETPEDIQKIFETAAWVKNAIYGKRIVLFAPLYISNYCANACRYCGFNSENKLVKRKALSQDEIKQQVEWLLNRGHKRILLVAGEAKPAGEWSLIDYYINAINAVYSVSVGPHKIRRVNINCAPLTVDEFKQLKSAGIGTYQIFQETYHEPTYRYVHPKGPKSDPNNRIEAIDRAFAAGIDDVGIGVLYGLYDYRFDTLAMLMHIEALENKFNVGPHTISVPRIEPAPGVEFTEHIPYRVADTDFKKLVAILRLSVPYTGIILSTRETPQLRDELVNLGVSQISAESNTAPGGYTSQEKEYFSDPQFAVSDHRTLDEVIGSLIQQKYIPSFCAACYRKERTGETFMALAKPGTIKGKCSINALITLKEYLDDFASDNVRTEGYKLIEQMKTCLTDREQKQLAAFFDEINRGIRDTYV